MVGGLESGITDPAGVAMLTNHFSLEGVVVFRDSDSDNMRGSSRIGHSAGLRRAGSRRTEANEKE